jgi:hypothetical protein
VISYQDNFLLNNFNWYKTLHNNSGGGHNL